MWQVKRLNPFWVQIHAIFFLFFSQSDLRCSARSPTTQYRTFRLNRLVGILAERVFISTALNKQRCFIRWLLRERYEVDGQPTENAPVFGRGNDTGMDSVSADACGQEKELRTGLFQVLVNVFID